MPYALANEEYSLPLKAIEFLCRKDIGCIAESVIPFLKNPLKLSEELSKRFSQEERRALMHYASILAKAREKFRLPAGLDFVFDRLAFEQATAKDISRHKAALWPAGSEIDDLCCGMGGDSFWLPPGARAAGSDISAERVLMYNENMERLGAPHRAAVRNALDAAGGDCFCIDPARRGGLNPSLQSILELAKKYRSWMIKLPPAHPESEIPKETDILYLGSPTDCRECLALGGTLGKETIRAAAISESKTLEWQCEKQELQSAKLQTKKPGSHILEPNPVLVRSHLFISEAKKRGLWQIDPTLAYLSCDSPAGELQGFAAYQIIDQSSLSTSEVKVMLKKHDAGNITLKKRGVEVEPEAEIRRLAPKGSTEYTLFYTRIQGEKRAILTKPHLLNSSIT